MAGPVEAAVAQIGEFGDLAVMCAQKIVQATMFEPLLAADPSFEERWGQFVMEWEDDPPMPLYLALSSLAAHLVEKLRNGDTARFPEIFAVVERWHKEGDAYVKEAASVGLLEDLQNLSGGSGERGVTFEPWLGPESGRWWKKLDQFWMGDGRALQTDK